MSKKQVTIYIIKTQNDSKEIIKYVKRRLVDLNKFLIYQLKM